MPSILNNVSLKEVNSHRFPSEGSFMPMIAEPGGPTLQTRIRMWTSLMAGPRTKFNLLVFARGCSRWPADVLELVENFVKEDNVFFMVLRPQPGVSDFRQLQFRIDDEDIGNYRFSTLVIPTNSVSMMVDIHNELLALGAPSEIERMNQFVADVVEIIQDWSCVAHVHYCGHPSRRILIIAPDEV